MSEEEVYAGNQIDFGSFENKLQKVAAEIDQLKDSFSKRPLRFKNTIQN